MTSDGFTFAACAPDHPGGVGLVSLWACNRCGALTVTAGMQTHINWHARLDVGPPPIG